MKIISYYFLLSRHIHQAKKLQLFLASESYQDKKNPRRFM